MVIKRWVPPKEQEELWSLTKTIRDGREKVTTTLSIEDRSHKQQHRPRQSNAAPTVPKPERSTLADFGFIDLSPPDRHHRQGLSDRFNRMPAAYVEDDDSSVITLGKRDSRYDTYRSSLLNPYADSSVDQLQVENEVVCIDVDSCGEEIIAEDGDDDSERQRPHREAVNDLLPLVDDDVINMLLRRWTPGNGGISTEQTEKISQDGDEAATRNVREATRSEQLEASTLQDEETGATVPESQPRTDLQGQGNGGD